MERWFGWGSVYLPLLHFLDHHATTDGIAGPVIDLAPLRLCVCPAIVTVTFALLDLVPIVTGPAHAVGVFVILATFALMLLEIGSLLFLADAHLAYAGTLRDTEATRIGRGRHHAVIDGFASGQCDQEQQK
jgi:hypothetical protein